MYHEHISLHFPGHPNISFSELHILFYLFICYFNFKPLNPISMSNIYIVVESSIVTWAIYLWQYPKDCEYPTLSRHQLPILSHS